MSHSVRFWLRLLATVGSFALAAAACNSGTSVTTAQGSPSEHGSMSMSMSPSEEMMMQPGAEKMHVAIVFPKPGLVLTSNTLTLRVDVSGYTDTCSYAGKQDMQGIGHYHVLLDGSLVNMFCTNTAKISMQNVTPGDHTIEVLPAQNDHTEIMGNGQEMPFTYTPSNPLPEITPSSSSGQPGIAILQPQNGATLAGNFTVQVSITNYQPACNLMGKPDVAGYGHWHVNVDSMTGPMMGMGGMLGMSCTTTFSGTTKGLQAGTTHTLFALLTDNGHAPIGVSDSIDFTVGG